MYKIVICVYKITNPNGTVYIGQSTNFKDRVRKYRNMACKEQFKLYASFKKYGFDKHTIEILEECEKEHLNDLEIFYINKYKSYPHGLNATPGGNGITDEIKIKIGNAHRGNKYSLGYKHTDEAKLKISLANKGRKKPPISNETRERKRIAMVGKKHTVETKALIAKKASERQKGISKPVSESMAIKAKAYAESQRGVPRTAEQKQKIRNAMPKTPVVDTSTGMVYETSKAAAEAIGINRFTLSWYLTGRRKTGNPTSIIFLKDYKQD